MNLVNDLSQSKTMSKFKQYFEFTYSLTIVEFKVMPFEAQLGYLLSWLDTRSINIIVTPTIYSTFLNHRLIYSIPRQCEGIINGYYKAIVETIRFLDKPF